jgi:hypothetical protein
MPEWEQLQRELLQFSKRKIYDMVLSKQLDRVLYKFQNRKSIWLRWVEQFQSASGTKGEGAPQCHSENEDTTKSF